MISHPTAETALACTNGDRAAARALIHDHLLDRARHEAALAARSINCRLGRHTNAPGGCANDGTGCICECHDGSGS